jgi:hypothetical protein
LRATTGGYPSRGNDCVIAEEKKGISPIIQ